MKVFIWIACIFVPSAINVLLRNAGLFLGGIFTAILYGIAVCSAKALTIKWDDRHNKAKEFEGIATPRDNYRMRNVMLFTVIGGLVATISYVVIFNLAISAIGSKLFRFVTFLPSAVWAIWFLVICCGFRRKFGKNIYSVNVLCFLPWLFDIFVKALLVRDVISMETVVSMASFIKWYSMIGITISVLIFEYKFYTHGKKKIKSNVAEEMKKSISSFMVKYATEKQGEIEDVAYIFAHAMQMINSSSEKELSKEMRANGVTADFGALNILQNFAMVEIKYEPLRDIIINRENGGPYDLYNAVNKEKLSKGYISQQQYEENERVGNTLRFVPNGHLWL